MFERSFHFVPAHKRKLFNRLSEWSADAIVFDLEDAVPAAEKPESAAGLLEFFNRSSTMGNWFVRVNGEDSGVAEIERDLLAQHPGVGLILPKADDPASIREALRFYGENRRVILLVESFGGISRLRELLAVPTLYGLGLGLEDLYSEMLFNADQLKQLTRTLRTEVSVLARAHGLLPIDTISTQLYDEKQLEQDALEARSCGMAAKFSIHPTQLPVINTVFSLDANAVEWANRITDKFTPDDMECGYVRQGDEIVSPPKVKKAHTIRKFVSYHETT